MSSGKPCRPKSRGIHECPDNPGNDPTPPLDDTDTVCDKLEKAAMVEFWIYAVPPFLAETGMGGVFLEERVRSAVRFSAIFKASVERLTGLKHVRSRPMPRGRVLTYMDPPVAVQVFQTHHVVPDPEDPELRLKVASANDGLLTIMFPVLNKLEWLHAGLHLSWQEEYPGYS